MANAPAPVTTLLDDLAAARNPDGGWGAYPGQPSQTEATALAALALHQRNPDIADGPGAVRWLRERQRPDGAWPPLDGVDMPSWMSSLAVLALGRLAPDAPEIERGVTWLLNLEGRGYAWYTKLLFRLFPERDVIELDPDLKGWPWLPDTFSWIEPTAYALIALKSLGSRVVPTTAKNRIDVAERMILDRMCPGGGWNYGNSVVLGEELWPYPDTTALALIALHGRAPGDEIDISLRALDRMRSENDSILALALTILCADLYGRDASALRRHLEGRLELDAEGAGTRAVALAGLALHDGENVFSSSVR